MWMCVFVCRPQIHQVCCSSPLTALGLCCDGGVVDDCGVCGGDNSCNFLADVDVAVSTHVGTSDPVFDPTTANYYR